MASRKSNLIELLGIMFIFSSIIPLVFSFLHVYVSLPSIPQYVEFPRNFYHIFLLYSCFIMIPLGWCLIDNEKWSKEAAILFMIISIVLGVSSLLIFGINPASTWIQSLFWTIVNFIYLGALLFVFPWNSSSTDDVS